MSAVVVGPKLNPARVPVPHLDPKSRIHSFDEVELGYNEDAVVAEASRCIQCPNAENLCRLGCPIKNRIPEWMAAVVDRDWPRAVELLRSQQSLPGVCGRVCDKANQCEGNCVVGARGDPVAIGLVERYISDWELREKRRLLAAEPRRASTGKKVAIVGSGPAGLTAAADLTLLGHQVTLFEALHRLGGVLTYGIPSFRLPRKVIATEDEFLRAIGVEFSLNTLVGQTVTLDELMQTGYDAAFLGVGAATPVLLGTPGENLNGVYSANEFLLRVNLMGARAYPEADTRAELGRRSAVIGAGNTAMDAAQTALRMGAREVTIVYRRSREEMPARSEEVTSAMDEGVVFRLLTNPVRFIGDAHGRLVAMECLEMGLGEPDASGRRRPVPKPGTEFTMEVDSVILATGTAAHPYLGQGARGLALSRWGTIEVNEATSRTNLDGVWAGGDVVTGANTVVHAIAAAQRAVADMDAYLRR